MAKETIRHTKGLPSVSYKEIDADVIFEDGEVYLLKQDGHGRECKCLIEKDIEFYKLMTADRVDEHAPPVIIHIHAASGCNLNCPVCYENKEGVNEPTLKELKGLLESFKGRFITLTGREPTCRQDLFKIIQMVDRKKLFY